VECADRIATKVAERTLEPVRAMVEHEGLSAVSVRTVVDRRRFDVTIRKARPDGPGRAPVYGWAVSEVEYDDSPRDDGAAVRLDDGGQTRASDPEDAYWVALEALRAALDSRPA
jgi:hypothetical protein